MSTEIKEQTVSLNFIRSSDSLSSNCILATGRWHNHVLRCGEKERGVSVLNATYYTYILDNKYVYAALIGRCAEKFLIGIHNSPLYTINWCCKSFIPNCRKMLMSHFCEARDREANSVQTNAIHQLLTNDFLCIWLKKSVWSSRFFFCTPLATDFPFYCRFHLLVFLLFV